MDEATERQLRVIRRIIVVTQAAGISAWLFGGWGLDARIGPWRPKDIADISVLRELAARNAVIEGR
jgi:hypothetical protein